MVFALPEDVNTQTKTNLEQALKLAETTANSAEQLFQLNVMTAKAASADAVNQVKALASARDVQEFTSLQTSFAQANAEKMAGYFRAIYGWTTQAQAEVSKLFETQVTEVNRNFTAALDKAARSAPTGSEFAFAAAKSALTAANQAYDAMTKVGKQVADLTEASVHATPVGARKKAA